MSEIETTGQGQEKYRSQLEAMVKRVKMLEQENEGLKTRIRSLEDAISQAETDIFPTEKSPTPIN